MAGMTLGAWGDATGSKNKRQAASIPRRDCSVIAALTEAGACLHVAHCFVCLEDTYTPSDSPSFDAPPSPLTNTHR